MAVDFKTVNTMAKKYANDVRKAMPIDKAVLFGSYAKGTADEQSDVDVCFFLPSFGDKRRVDVIRDLLKLTRGYKDTYFEPIAFPTSEIERGNPFVQEVLRSGVEI